MQFTKQFSKVLAAFALSLFLLPVLAFAQYTRTDLVTDATDSDLLNAWGLTRSNSIPGFPGSPFWVSDNGTGKSTLYNGAGQKLGLIVTIPPAPGSTAMGTPTGTVFNITLQTKTPSFSLSKTASFPAIFLFATQDGTVSGWNPGVQPTTAVIAADRSGSGAVYTGLAIAENGGQPLLYAADDGPNRRIDVFDGTFTLREDLGSGAFVDPNIPGGFAPYGIQTITDAQGTETVWVTYTALNKAQSGFVSAFSTTGVLRSHFDLHGPLHSPWGIAQAPSNFGPMSNAILISNNTSRGRINAFDPHTGTFLGPLRDANGEAIEINQLWGIEFGNGGRGGQPNELFFTAGPNGYANGLFGKITANP